VWTFFFAEDVEGNWFNAIWHISQTTTFAHYKCLNRITCLFLRRNFTCSLCRCQVKPEDLKQKSITYRPWKKKNNRKSNNMFNTLQLRRNLIQMMDIRLFVPQSPLCFRTAQPTDMMNEWKSPQREVLLLLIAIFNISTVAFLY